ncbi:hypothetical protein Pan97_39510 [Bremerella volcania]|uniref:Antitoxin n=2 Tax=Bremerella volcania TaxID=2527984 RepID=A0A518CCG7_9BACT|nr:hypothetical protein Pan97_39510 [Bremerella volcania]
MRITHLRDSLGWAYQSVANTDEPIVIQRYSKQDVVMVPLWEWQFLKQIEASIRAGEYPWLDAQMANPSPTVGPSGDDSADLAKDANA